jgi:hypothetical protein
MNVLAKLFDERFLEHRRRSNSVAAVIGAMTAAGLFAYRYYFDHRWSWDLFAVVITIAAVKLALMTWYLLTD